MRNTIPLIFLAFAGLHVAYAGFWVLRLAIHTAVEMLK